MSAEKGSSASGSAGLARVTAAALLWGTIPLVVRNVDVHPAVIVFWRVTFAAALLLAYQAFTGALPGMFRLPRRRLAAFALMGALLALNWVLFMWAYTLTDVAVAVLLAYLGPVFVAVLAPVVERQPFDRRLLLPLLLSVAGTAVIVGPRELSLGGGELLGAGMAATSALTYAILLLLAKRTLAGVPTATVMLGEELSAAILLLPAALLLPGPRSLGDWSGLAVLGVVHTGVTGLMFLSGLRIARTEHVAILTYAEPVSATLFAALLLSEPLTAGTAIGGALVVAGGVLVARLSRIAASEEAPVISLSADD